MLKLRNPRGSGARGSENCHRSWHLVPGAAFLACLFVLPACGVEEEEALPGTTSHQPLTCSSTPDCKAVGGTCQNNVCKADNECTTDVDCKSGQVCIPDKSFGGLCGAKGSPPVPGPAWACKADADCPTNQLCQSNGKCGAKSSPVSPTKEICNNKIDDDQDGDVDCKDKDCEREAVCQGSSSTCNGQPCPCNVLQQNCQTAGYRCWPGGPWAADGLCYPSGPVKEGGACVEPPVNGPQACAKGLLCVADSAASQAICRKLCGSSASCKSNETCKSLAMGSGVTKDYGVCVAAPPPPPPPPPPPCDLFKQNCTKSTDMCAPQEYFDNKCIPAGSGVKNSACTAQGDCAPKLMCATIVGSSGSTVYYYGFGDIRGGNCMTICSIVGTSPSTCPAGTTCSAVNLSSGGLGVCAP